MGIKVIEYYQVADVLTEDGRGSETVIGRFWDEKVANRFSIGRGNYGSDAKVRKVELVIADEQEDMDAYHVEEVRQKALKKLTEKERKALGLA